MMDFKKKSLIVLLIISVFLLSSCEVYQTLYGAPADNTKGETPPTGNVVAPVDNEMPVPGEDVDEMIVEETESEAQAAEEKPEPVFVEGPKEKPVVVIVEETQLVSLEPKGEDPDKDTSLVYTFTSPLSENGEWQTKYGDAGEYTVTVTVSDGESVTARDVLVIVNKKEETPIIEGSKPIETGLTIDETQAVDFSVTASDLNNDPLAYSWKLDANQAGDQDKYTYQSTYDDAGTHTVKVEVSDGLSSVSKIWSINVLNVNRKPVLELINDINAKETDQIVITALATDDDNDPITYSISDERFVQEGNVFTWETDYDSAGTYKVVVSASDGQDTTEQEFTVTVENVNRPPMIVDIVQRK